ncbi:hypothetical protein FB563_7348 [Streptomyces puniciscabiei]|uniref:Uncharacterized protein n=1 Tax=Streptomyces puniciscabiei TaxID=164348 RepID=A0A542T047_9ACTN|nr:hypothetical protein FB563_7348 [Streptomyces puniciscabiei]
MDLSVPEVYSGTDFTLYLHIKNPFAVPVWVKSVVLSLPTQLYWRSPDAETRKASREKHVQAERSTLERVIETRNQRILEITQELSRLPADAGEQTARLLDVMRTLLDENSRDVDLLAGQGNARVRADGSSTVNLHSPRTRNLTVEAHRESTINVYDIRPVEEEPERVPLTGSLPPGAALEPGCTDVQTIRLGTRRNPLFLPARYHLQLTVIYTVEPPRDPAADTAADSPHQRVFSNTTSFTVPVKAALWKVMSGGVIGGFLGGVGRALQQTRHPGALIETARLLPLIGALLLAVILSGVAIIFSARKSDAQSFVTVEDFWGGLLVGFLIGYSGTAAFSDITHMKV